VSCPLAISQAGLLLSDTLNRVSFHPVQRDYPMTPTIHPPAHRLSFHVCMDLGYWQWRAGISGLNTKPASLLPPASDSSYEACLRVQLLTCWPGFSQVGLSRTRFRITHWVTITHFIPTYRDSQGLGFPLARGVPC